MKLYATTTSDRGSRPAKKGGDQQIKIELHRGNLHIATIQFNSISENNTLLNISQHLTGHEIIIHKPNKK